MSKLTDAKLKKKDHPEVLPQVLNRTRWVIPPKSTRQIIVCFTGDAGAYDEVLSFGIFGRVLCFLPSPTMLIQTVQVALQGFRFGATGSQHFPEFALTLKLFSQFASNLFLPPVLHMCNGLLLSPINRSWYAAQQLHLLVILIILLPSFYFSWVIVWSIANLQVARKLPRVQGFHNLHEIKIGQRWTFRMQN